MCVPHYFSVNFSEHESAYHQELYCNTLVNIHVLINKVPLWIDFKRVYLLKCFLKVVFIIKNSNPQTIGSQYRPADKPNLKSLLPICAWPFHHEHLSLQIIICMGLHTISCMQCNLHHSAQQSQVIGCMQNMT